MWCGCELGGERWCLCFWGKGECVVIKGVLSGVLCLGKGFVRDD